MEQSQNNYYIRRTCSACGDEQVRVLSRRQAAFEASAVSKLFENVCKKCSSTASSTLFPAPPIDLELLKEWAKDPLLSFAPQDEDLVLAEEDYLGHILETLDTVPLTDHKRNLLMSALCVIVYDNSHEENLQCQNHLKERVIEELNKRKDKLRMAEDWIMDYIKEVVYPQLDLK
jgi:hypothetical protein